MLENLLHWFSFDQLLGLSLLAFYLLGWACAVHALSSARTAQGTVAWLVSLVSFPFLAVPAYLVFGRNRFEGRVHAFEARADDIEQLLRTCDDALAPFSLTGADSPGWYRAVAQLSRSHLVSGNSAQLLINGQATFASILSGIAGAERYVLVQFYMIHDDQLGRELRDCLIERANAGVSVNLLYDEIGSWGLSDSFLAPLHEAGVNVSGFKPEQGRRNRFQINFRNHRKMVVVDGHTGWLGGLNVGDEYMDRVPALSPWRDTHMRLEGPVVLQLQSVMLLDWYWATRQLPALNWQPRPAGDLPAMILATGPTGPLEAASLYFVSAFSAARERIWLTAPYFVPDEAVMKALQLAALRGVDVRILTTGKPDSWLVHLAAYHYFYALKDVNVTLMASREGFMHQKVCLIDDRATVVGSHNMDNRSFRLNFEVAVIVDDPALARETEAMLAEDFANAEQLQPRDWDARPLWWWAAVRLARLLSPVL